MQFLSESHMVLQIREGIPGHRQCSWAMSPVPALIAHKPRIIGDRYSASAKKKQKTKIDNYREYIIGNII